MKSVEIIKRRRENGFKFSMYAALGSFYWHMTEADSQFIFDSNGMLVK